MNVIFGKQEIKFLDHVIPHSTVELSDNNGKVKGEYNWKSIKAYVEPTSQT
jgi:hypothetical protein